MTSPPIIELDRVSKHYETPGDLPPLAVLDDVSLQVAAGDSIAIVGPSGSGKSTLLNIMGTLDRPTSGQVMFGDRDLSSQSEAELAALRSREIGFVFQLHHLLPQLTVVENVLLPALASGERVSAETVGRAEELLGRVGLGQHRQYLPGRLSGGERQRVAVVRALINEPRILLADEPTGALDQTTAAELADLLHELHSESGQTLIVATHSINLAQRAEKVLRLQGGHLEACQ